MSTFGIIVSGRPVLTDAQIISPTQVAYQIPSSPAFSHIVVFLLPGATLPDGTAAAVYAQLPGASDFRLLGAIAPSKPSAIFKVNSASGPGDADAMLDETSTGTAPLALGISLEPAASVAAALEAQKQPSAGSHAESRSNAESGSHALVLHGQGQLDQKALAQRIIKNCYDFLTSWGSGDTVPLKAFQAWWTKFEGRMERDPGFLERSDGG
jgi:hypothetical protein